MPNLFQSNWQPQVMPQINMALQNNFNNFNLASLGHPQQYPPQNSYPPQQNNMMQQQHQNSNMGMNQGGMGNTPHQGY